MTLHSTIQLGHRYIDEITGFKGIATAITHFIHGDSRVCLETLDENIVIEEWFDEGRLEEAEEELP